MSEIRSLPAPPLVDWPRDEHAHDDLPWEIWWITADVHAGDRRLAAHLMFTHLGGGQLRTTVTVTDVDTELEHSTRLASSVNLQEPGQELSIATEIGSFEGTFEGGYRIMGRLDEHTGFDLALTATTPVLFSAGAGQFTLGKVTTTQYSIGALQASGQVRLDGVDLQVAGTAWYDRQWIHSGTLQDGGGVFSWLGLCLDNGDTISVWDTSMRAEGGRTWATIVRPDGTHIVTSAEPVAPTATGMQSTALGHEIPRGWRLSIPYVGGDLVVNQRLVQDAPGYFFYTGVLDVTGHYEGAGVAGSGFCDLVGWSQ